MHSPRAFNGVLARLVVLTLLAFGLAVPSAFALDYPLPTFGDGTVSSSTVQAGTCVTFSGGGFAPNTPITIYDNNTVVGHTRSNSAGDFSTPVCFSTDATLGAHSLRATGLGANGAGRTVTAGVTVVGAAVSGVSGGNSPSGDGGGLPFTGSDIRDLVLFGLALLASGWFLTRRGYAARAQRRASRLAA